MKEKKGEERKKKTNNIGGSQQIPQLVVQIARQRQVGNGFAGVTRILQRQSTVPVCLYIAFCALLTSDGSAKSLRKTSISG